MRAFAWNKLDEALAWSASGNQSLHLHRFLTPGAPRCFVAAVNRGEFIAHLFDLDEARLTATARELGVRVVYIDKAGTPRMHVDLCGAPLKRALEGVTP